jgi:phage terminase large subunit GpA-like protein
MINKRILEEIIECAAYKISTISPSIWAERNIIMPRPIAGPLRYDLTTPFNKEIIDRLSPDDPVRDIAVMGAAQYGKTSTIILPAIGWIIENNPGNIIMTVGHDSLMKEAMDNIDNMLDTTGLRKLIKPSANRARKTKSGDTDEIKQFPGGYLKLSPASNEKIWQQASYKFGFIDDYERVKGKSKIAGNTRDLIQKRFTVNAKTYKILYTSSPELADSSNILEVYNMGDQRKFMVPCPCCGDYIVLEWEVAVGKETAGMTWQLDNHGRLIENSVGYICQRCSGFFTDSIKYKIIPDGYWKPTKEPFRPDFTSYHMNALYSPAGMTDWKSYVYSYLECCPPGQSRKESKYQTFINLNLGIPYKKESESPKATELQNNIRNYDIGTIPENLSIQDGNGKIILLTCACDLNGKEDDARLDYEVVAWSESGASYSIEHGSIGTFIPLEGENKSDREKWTYQHYKDRSVWPEFNKVVEKVYHTDTGRGMAIFITGVDTGHYTDLAYSYVDTSNYRMISLKGDKENKYIKFGIDVPNFKLGKERANLYLVQVNQVKDELSSLMKLKFNPHADSKQPYGFMNFPLPSGDKYQFKTFFSHYEGEHRVTDNVDGEVVQWSWRKKSASHQNHFWDVRVYNMALRDITVMMVCKELKLKTYTWFDLVQIIKSAA